MGINYGNSFGREWKDDVIGDTPKEQPSKYRYKLGASIVRGLQQYDAVGSRKTLQVGGHKQVGRHK